MGKHLRYFRYLCRHKWFVFLACWKLGIPWQGVTHDLSKFLPSEWFPYVEFFYGAKKPKLMETHGEERQTALNTGYFYERTEGEFDGAWLLHQKRNPHHWQFWLLPLDNGGTKVLEMPDRYRLEMLADWKGAGMAQNRPDTFAWYVANRDKMTMGPETRRWIERQLGFAMGICVGREIRPPLVIGENEDTCVQGEGGAG